ncbi:MAG: long-chain fatty acid--CoA ligase [Polyangiaceae bacterium]|jgi:fatty-acyl-CoA synthase
MLDARMMDFPLTLTHLVSRARAYFGRSEVVSRRADGSIHRTTFGEVLPRAARLAHALAKLGVKRGDRVATLCWNHARHLEAYCAIPTMGAVLHTLNLRLSPDDLAYIAGHAEDRVVIVDDSLLPLLRQFKAKVPSLAHVIVVREKDGTASPDAEGFLDYEAILAPEKDDFPYPDLDERSAAILCYTSGTTGRPKGVLYTHRSTVLHSLAISTVDVIGLGNRDVVLPVVPLFHANAWGLPYACIATGAKIVFPGPHLDAKSILDLMVREKVTIAAGVPTIWLGILHVLDQAPGAHDLSSVRTMLIGGSAAPPSMIDGFLKRHGLEITHAWGMTEMNPLGTIARVKQHLAGGGDEATLAIRSTQGYPAVFVETRHTDDTGRVLPWDAQSMGELEVRGCWVASSYFRDEDASRWTKDGWFKTGDVVTIDSEGYVRICDRSKDVIKSGGEWISSVELENALMSHPAVLEAAVFAGVHEKWAERPIAAVVVKPGQAATKEELTRHLEGKVAKFWLPDAYVFIEQVPRTSTGKFLKTRLRELYGNLLVKGGG